METKHEKKHSGSAFLWGFILGAIFATLLTTKKGRAILRELINTGMEMIEDFVEERKTKAYEKKLDEKEKIIVQEENDQVAQVAEDLATDIEPEEEDYMPGMDVEEVVPERLDVDDVSEEALKFAKKMESETDVVKPTKRGSKRRLFRGIRKGRAN